MKEGSSDRLHIDFNDDINTLSWVIALGDFEGGEFCSPQLGCKIPMLPRQALGAATRVMVHSGSLVTKGRRIVLTFFSDKTLMKHGDKYKT